MSLKEDRIYREAIEQKRALREAAEKQRLEAFRKSLRRDPDQTVGQLARAFKMAPETVSRLRREMGLAPGAEKGAWR